MKNKTISIITKDNNQNLYHISDISKLLFFFEIITKEEVKDIVIDNNNKSILNIYLSYKEERKLPQYSIHRATLVPKYYKIITKL